MRRFMSGLDLRHRLWSGGHHRRNAGMCGLGAITAGMVNAMFGFPGAGIVHLIRMLSGFNTAGSIAMAAGCWLKDTGANSSE